MKLSNTTLALLGLTATALGSAVPRAALPECTEGNNNTTACGSLYSYGNDVFQCANLRWDWVERCSDPDVHCDNGACVPKQPECIEGEKECLTVLNRGYDGINICKNGTWASLDKCHCTDFPSPHCTLRAPGIPRDQPATASRAVRIEETDDVDVTNYAGRSDYRCGRCNSIEGFVSTMEYNQCTNVTPNDESKAYRSCFNEFCGLCIVFADRDCQGDIVAQPPKGQGWVSVQGAKSHWCY